MSTEYAVELLREIAALKRQVPRRGRTLKYATLDVPVELLQRIDEVLEPVRPPACAIP